MSDDAGAIADSPVSDRGRRTLNVAQVFEQARTAHLERVRDQQDANISLMYRTESYDFDPRLALLVAARRTGRLRMVVDVVRASPDVVEVNEPLFVRAWPTIVAGVIGALLTRALRRKKVAVVTYAIENGDALGSLARHVRRAPRSATALGRAVATFLMRRMDRIAFGTDGSAANYTAMIRRPWTATTRIFTPLQAACDCEPASKSDTVLYLGSLDARKGLPELLGAWQQSAALAERAKLVIAGQGVMAAEVGRWAAARPEVEFLVDPPRASIHRTLRVARVVVLPSRRTPHWREQVGLPIVEGLAHGCEIVASEETGLAAWLKSNGHQVLDIVSASTVASAITVALDSPRDPAAITRLLPPRDGRIEAQQWMFGELPGQR